MRGLLMSAPNRLAVWCSLLVAAAGTASGRAAAPYAPARQSSGEFLVEAEVSGQPGGRLIVALRSEPKTLNPVIAADGPSREVIGLMTADLIHINRASHESEPALARSWDVSADGRQYTIHLRRGIRFSDGMPFDADDVIFTFQVLLDERSRAPQRDLLVIAGKPLEATKLDAHTVRFTLAEPYAAAERLFDSIAMLPQHQLQSAYEKGQLPQAWTLASTPSDVAGLGPFRLKQYVAGERLVLERNPHYWKVDRRDNRLPYLSEVVFSVAPNEDTQVLRFTAGESHVINRISAENFAVLRRDQQQKQVQLYDLGPGLEYNFVLFNQNDLTSKNLSAIVERQRWFQEKRFRQAVSLAIDREAIVRLAYQGRATPLWGNVSPGNRRWVNAAIPHPPRSLEGAMSLLRDAGFTFRGRSLFDGSGRPVEFSLIVSSSSSQRLKMATLVQADLAELGMRVHVVPLEFRALVDRVFQTFNYEASLFGLLGGDADPNSEINVWMSRGTSHLWSLGQREPAASWEAEIDQLMQQQMITPDYRRRKTLYDRVQAIVAENLPLVFLASPHALVAARREVGNFRPAVLDPQTLWNVEELFFHSVSTGSDHVRRHEQ
jgi:peptide/nickel transport system substrate-binding protein